MPKTSILLLSLAASAVSVWFLVGIKPAAQISASVEKTPPPARASLAPTPVPDPLPPVETVITEAVVTQLRLAADPGAFLARIRQVPGITQVAFDGKSFTLTITHDSAEHSPKSLATMAEQAGLDVRGEVLDLPLALAGSHLETCGSCGYQLYAELQKKSGVHAVEVFIPVKNQLRLLVEPESITPFEISRLISVAKHAPTP